MGGFDDPTVLQLVAQTRPEDANDRSSLDCFFHEHEHNISPEQREVIMKIIDNVSYSKEKKRIAAGLETKWHRTCVELHWCVHHSPILR